MRRWGDACGSAVVSVSAARSKQIASQARRFEHELVSQPMRHPVQPGCWQPARTYLRAGLIWRSPGLSAAWKVGSQSDPFDGARSRARHGPHSRTVCARNSGRRTWRANSTAARVGLVSVRSLDRGSAFTPERCGSVARISGGIAATCSRERSRYCCKSCAKVRRSDSPPAKQSCQSDSFLSHRGRTGCEVGRAATRARHVRAPLRRNLHSQQLGHTVSCNAGAPTGRSS